MQAIMNVVAYVVKNLAVWIGVVEAVMKALAAIVSVTPTKKDDEIMAIVDRVFSQIKKVLYDISDKFAGKV